MGYALLPDLEYIPCLARRVLVVQPENPQRKLIVGALTLWGLEPVCADNLSAAAEQLIHQPDYLLVDQHLPDGPCLSLLHRLHRRDEPAAVGVMLEPGEGLLPDLLASHPDAVFPKPLSMRCVHSWLQNHRPRLVRWNDGPGVRFPHGVVARSGA